MKRKNESKAPVFASGNHTQDCIAARAALQPLVKAMNKVHGARGRLERRLELLEEYPDRERDYSEDEVNDELEQLEAEEEEEGSITKRFDEASTQVQHGSGSAHCPGCREEESLRRADAEARKRTWDTKAKAVVDAWPATRVAMEKAKRTSVRLSEVAVDAERALDVAREAISACAEGDDEAINKARENCLDALEDEEALAALYVARGDISSRDYRVRQIRLLQAQLALFTRLSAPDLAAYSSVVDTYKAEYAALPALPPDEPSKPRGTIHRLYLAAVKSRSAALKAMQEARDSLSQRRADAVLAARGSTLKADVEKSRAAARAAGDEAHRLKAIYEADPEYAATEAREEALWDEWNWDEWNGGQLRRLESQ